MADKFVSWLETAGKAALHITEEALGKVVPIAAEVAQEAEPIVNLALPMYGPTYNKVVSAVIATEQAYAASGQQNGTGAQKLQAVLEAVESELTPILNKAGVTGDAATEALNNYVSSIVGMLNGPVIASTVSKGVAATGAAQPA
jgi:hypothetical protein